MDHIMKDSPQPTANPETVPVEMVTAAAVQWEGVIYRGWSHARALEEAREAMKAKDANVFLKFLGASRTEEIPKGFLTSQDRFVNRREALRIALAANQIEDRYKNASCLQSFMIVRWG